MNIWTFFFCFSDFFVFSVIIRSNGKVLGRRVDLLLSLLVWAQGRLLLSSVLLPTSPGQSDNLWVIISRLAYEPVSAWTCETKRAVPRWCLLSTTSSRAVGGSCCYLLGSEENTREAVPGMSYPCVLFWVKQRSTCWFSFIWILWPLVNSHSG